MKASGVKHERETIIGWNEEDDNAWIWTASDTVYRRLLKRLGRAYLTVDGERHAEFRFPKAWILLPRPKRAVSEAKRAELRERASRTLLGRQTKD